MNPARQPLPQQSAQRFDSFAHTAPWRDITAARETANAPHPEHTAHAVRDATHRSDQPHLALINHARGH